MFELRTEPDPTYLINTRLSFSQLLLLLAYTLLESSLPAKIGDTRQLQDILSRKQDDWHPQIGDEKYPEMRERSWDTITSETRRAWENIREYLVQQNLIDPTVSSEEIRGHLSRFLFSIQQISSQALDVLCCQNTIRDVSSALFPEKGSLTLVCISVSVIATPGGSISLRSLLHDPDQHLIREMGSQLCASPLFQDGISLHILWDAFASLDMVFSSGVYNAIDDEPFAASPPHDQMPWIVVSKQESWTYRYELSETQEAFSPIRSHTSGGKRPREAKGRDTLDVAEPVKCRKSS